MKPDTGSPQGIQIVRLDSVPIKDCWHEKALWEAGDFARKLNEDYSSFVVVQNEDANRRRIVEVYRLCFESADSNNSRLKVIRDFTAHFPDLVFGADWIKEQVRRESVEDGFSKTQKDVFRVVCTGLRSASGRQPRETAVQRFYRISAARLMVKETIKPEIFKWDEGLNRASDPTPEWILQQAEKKTKELTETHSIRGRRAVQRLTEYLTLGHCYDAAALIVSELLNVAERDIESKIE